MRDAIELFEEAGWDWTYHAFREWQGWISNGDNLEVILPRWIIQQVVWCVNISGGTIHESSAGHCYGGHDLPLDRSKRLGGIASIV
jgi:hypothetical protein